MELVAICDTDREALEKGKQAFGLKSFQGFQDFCDFLKTDLEIVIVGTSIPFHAEQSIKALESGKHVLSEVNAADTMNDTKKLLPLIFKEFVKTKDFTLKTEKRSCL